MCVDVLFVRVHEGECRYVYVHSINPLIRKAYMTLIYVILQSIQANISERIQAILNYQDIIS